MSIKSFLALSLISGCLSLPLQAQGAAAETAACKEFNPALLSFQSDEVLFTVLAWLHWIGDRDEALELREYDAVQSDLMGEISHNPALKALKNKHRAAYEAYLQGTEPYAKNGLLLSDSLYYGQPPGFKVSASPAQLKTLNPVEQERVNQLPASALIAEFYQVMKLGRRWKEHYKPAYEKYLQQYRGQALAGIQRAQCFLKVQPRGPVTVLFNPLDSFGTGGQTSYDPFRQRYVLKLHINLKYTTPENIEEVAAHEYTHALMNHHLEPLRPAFSKKFASLADAVHQPELAYMPIQELFARAVENLPNANRSQDLLDEKTFYESNPVLLHLHAQQSAYLASGKSFEEFLPAFLQSFDPVKTSQDWQDISSRIELKAFSSESILKQLQTYRLDQAELLAAIKAHQALMQPKLEAFYTQSGTKPDYQSLSALVFECFAQAQYVGADPDIRENVFYIYKNPLFYHFSEKLAASRGKVTAEPFIRELFASFDPAAEATRWQAVGKRLDESE